MIKCELSQNGIGHIQPDLYYYAFFVASQNGIGHIQQIFTLDEYEESSQNGIGHIQPNIFNQIALNFISLI